MTEYQKRLRAVIVGDDRIDSPRNRREMCQEFGVTTSELERDLEQTREQLSRLNTALYSCTGAACRCRRQSFPEMPGIPVVETACLGPCKQAPVAKLQLEQQAQVFARVDSSEKTEAVVSYARKARQEQSLMIDSGPAQELLFDPHHPEKKSSAMSSLSFLVGRFKGSGTILETGESFFKEVEGRWEASGRFISLRQRATYGDDVHEALVIVGETSALAYRDDGEEKRYSPQWRNNTLLFEDRVPHRARARAARKRLIPTLVGYREELEITRDGSTYLTYYSIDHERLEVSHARL